ncbi:hypothetical protein H8959_006565 [Pygathrix nigripes]
MCEAHSRQSAGGHLAPAPGEGVGQTLRTPPWLPVACSVVLLTDTNGCRSACRSCTECYVDGVMSTRISMWTYVYAKLSWRYSGN